MEQKAFFDETGGLTLSGGEPLAQPKFALSLLEQMETTFSGFGSEISETIAFQKEKLLPGKRYAEQCMKIFGDDYVQTMLQRITRSDI